MSTQFCIFNQVTNLIDVQAGVDAYVASQNAGSPIVLNSSGNLDLSFISNPVPAFATVNMVVGDLVNLFYNASGAQGAGIYARLANAASASSLPAHGYMSATATSGATITVYTQGMVEVPFSSGYTLSDVGAPIYLSTTNPGQVQKTLPTGSDIIQPLGYILGVGGSNVSFLFLPLPVVAASGGGGGGDFVKLNPTGTQVVTQPASSDLIVTGDPSAQVIITIPLNVDANTQINGNLLVNGSTVTLNGATQITSTTYQTSTVSVASSIASNGDSRFGFGTNGDINTASSFNSSGGFGARQRTVTSDTTLQTNDYSMFVDASGAGADVNITLPDATAFANILVPGNFNTSLTDTTTIEVGRIFIIKKVDSSGNHIIVNAVSGQLIDGSGTLTLSAQYDFVVLQTDGTNWGVVGH